MYPFERFSEDAKGVLILAQQEAERSHHSYVGTEHLVIGLARQHGLAGQALVGLGLDAETLRQALGNALKEAEGSPVTSMIPTARVKRVIEMAFEEARQQKSSHVGTNHMLLALLTEGEGKGAQVLRERGLTVSKAQTELDRLQATGISEQPGKPAKAGPRTQRRLEIPDQQGRLIEVSLVFPEDYSAEECQAAIDRIQAALL
jgi:ATP-dependent Clp protease ATP-binding subunit ClpC